MGYSQPLTRLIEAFQKLPGIGPKSAQRLAFHMLKQPNELVEEFATALVEAKNKIGFCQECFNLSSQSPCEICQNTHRQTHLICVVAESRDLFALERTNEFSGQYHVLHGLISPLDGIGPEDLKIQELIQRIAEANRPSVITPVEDIPDELRSGDDEISTNALGDASSSVATVAVAETQTPESAIQELILALPPSIEGDTTSLYISQLLRPLGIKVTRIAFGLPVGGDLEYADSMTLARALQGRQEV